MGSNEESPRRDGGGWAVVRIEGAVCRIPVSDEWLGVRPDEAGAA